MAAERSALARVKSYTTSLEHSRKELAVLLESMANDAEALVKALDAARQELS